ncbi:MAG: metal ABC transporter permease [Deltaproteobacteria bacterium]|nr:metal ABC transporter permease [Deltaproteobacteria bacterium]
MNAFFEAWPLFRDPALAGTMAGAFLGFLGIYVVLRRFVFLTAAISQAAGLGVALSFFLRVLLIAPLLGTGHEPAPEGTSFGVSLLLSLTSPTVGALVVTLLAILPITNGRGPAGARRDSYLGVVFLVGSAGTLAIGTRIVQELQDIQSLLFGSAVAILPSDFRLLASVTFVTLAVHIWGWRGFTAVSFDPDGAKVRGLPVKLLDLLLFVSLAVGISISTRILGALPTFGFSVLPAIAAVQISANVGRAFVWATLFGAASGFLGYLLAFLYEFPVGASQVLVAGAFVLAAIAVEKVRPRAQRPRPVPTTAT